MRALDTNRMRPMLRRLMRGPAGRVGSVTDASLGPVKLRWSGTTPSAQTFPETVAAAQAITGRTFSSIFLFDQASGAPRTVGPVALTSVGTRLFERTLPCWDGSSMIGLRGMEFAGVSTGNYSEAANATDFDGSESLTFVACLRILRVGATRCLLGKQSTSTTAGYRVTVAGAGYPFAVLVHNGTTSTQALPPGSPTNEIDGGMNGAMMWWAFKINLTAGTSQILGFRAAGTTAALPAGSFASASKWRIGAMTFAAAPETLQLGWLGVLTGAEAEAFDLDALNALDDIARTPSLYASYARASVTVPEVAYESGFGLRLAAYHGSAQTTGLAHFPHAYHASATKSAQQLGECFGRGATVAGPNKRNNFLRSDDLSHAAWTRTNMSATANVADDPLGFRAAAQLTATAANATITQTVAITANRAQAMSVYVRRAGGSDVSIKLRHVDTATTTIVEGTFTATSEWTRVKLLGQHFTATSVRYELEIVDDAGSIYATCAQQEYGWLTPYQPQRAALINRASPVYYVDNAANRYYDPVGGAVKIAVCQFHDNMVEDAYVFSTGVSDDVTINKDRMLIQVSDHNGSGGAESEAYDLDVQHHDTATAMWAQLNAPNIDRSGIEWTYCYAWDTRAPRGPFGAYAAVQQDGAVWDTVGSVVPAAPMTAAAEMPRLYPGCRYTSDASIEGLIEELVIHGPAS